MRGEEGGACVWREDAGEGGGGEGGGEGGGVRVAWRGEVVREEGR